MKLRYVELAPIDGENTAVRTVANRWYTVSAPISDVESTLRSLPDAASGSDGRDDLIRILQRDGSVSTASAAWASAPKRMIVTGRGPLVKAVASAELAHGLPTACVVSLEELEDDELADSFLLIDWTGLSEQALRDVGRLCEKHGAVWAPAAVAQAAGWFGPVFDDRPGPSLEDLLGRWATTADRRPWLDGCAPLPLGQWSVPPSTETAWIAAAVATESRRYFEGEDDRIRWRELELGLADLSATRHLVLPLPVSAGGDAAPLEFACPMDDLVDERTGVITRLVEIDHHPSIPRQLITVHAHIGAMRRISQWYTDPVAGGTSFVSRDAARQAAIGEAIERYSGDIVRPDLLWHGTWEQLAERGCHAVDPETLVLFSPRQYAMPGFPFVPLTRQLPVHWVRGRSLTRDCPAWLPASLVYGNWYTGPYKDAPHVNNTFHPGLAAGPDLGFAIAAGIQEIIERHSTMVWWHNAQPLPSVRPTARLAALWDGGPSDFGQRARLVALPNEFDVPVLAGIVEHIDDELLTIGFAARPDAEQAAFKAWAEGLTLQDGARDLLRPDGGFRQSAARGEINGSHVKPWRADRRYLDSYRPDFHDAVDLMCQLQVYLDPRAIERVRHLLDTPQTVDLGDLPSLPEYSVEAYQRVVERRGYEIFYADITTRDVHATGARVVRVLVPGLVPNFAAAFPFLGRGRLQADAVELGWRDRPLAEHEINIMPLPHA